MNGTCPAPDSTGDVSSDIGPPIGASLRVSWLPVCRSPRTSASGPVSGCPSASGLPTYQRRWLKGDLIAGSVVAALAIPQSLGYATIAGLPVQVGLYSLPTVLIVYAILGTSRKLIVGPVSTVALLTGSLIAGFKPESQAEAVALAAGMAITAGLLLMLASVLHIGWVAEFLSKPIVTGFVLGLTILVIIGELPNILGIPGPPTTDVMARIQNLATGLDDIHPQTVVVGVVSLALMFGGTKLAPKVPWALVTLLVGLVASNALDLAADGVRVVGEVPQGLPTPSLPGIPLSDWSQVILAGAAVAFVGLAEGLSAARLYATEDARVDASQELLAVGRRQRQLGHLRRLRRGREPVQDRHRRPGRWALTGGRADHGVPRAGHDPLPGAGRCRPCPRRPCRRSSSTPSGGSWTSSRCAGTPSCAATTSSPPAVATDRRPGLRPAAGPAPGHRALGVRAGLPVQPGGRRGHGSDPRGEGRVGRHAQPPGAPSGQGDPRPAGGRARCSGSTPPRSRTRS